MEQSQFSKNLSFYRKKRGFTQECLAQMLSVTPQAVSKWEKGSYPDGNLLPALAKALDVSLDVLFGLKPEEQEQDPVQTIMESIHALPEEQRSTRFLEICYHMLYAYHDSIQMEYVHFPNQLPKETFAQLRSDSALAIQRLNADMQYLCFLKIPQEGIDSYVQPTNRILQLFRFLSNPEALRVIFYAETLPRNHVLTKQFLSKTLGIPLKCVSKIVSDCLALGIMWEQTASIDGPPFPVYSYVHNIPLIAILTLATSLTNFIANREPDIDIWSAPPFRSQFDTNL